MSDKFITDLLKMVPEWRLMDLLALALKEERYEHAAAIRDEITVRPMNKAMWPCDTCGRIGCRTLHNKVTR